jgi:hypothetical protein
MSNIIKSGGPPNLPTIWNPVKFRHFYQFVDDIDDLRKYADGLLGTRSMLANRYGHIPEVEDVKCKREGYTELIESCRESMRRYDYDGENDPRYDEDGDLSFDYVAQRLAAMMDAWSNTPKFEDEDAAARFGRIMVEHVLALEPSAAVLESACRKLIDHGGEFSPVTPQVVAMVRAEKEVWQPRKQALDDISWAYQDIIEQIPKAKAAAERRRAEEAEAAARQHAEAAAQREVDEAIAAEQKAVRIADELYDAEERGRTNNYCYDWSIDLQFTDGRNWYVDDPSDDVRKLDIGEKCYLSFAIGVVETRRKFHIWANDVIGRAIASERDAVAVVDPAPIAPALPPTRKRRVHPAPKPPRKNKLAAAGKRVHAKRSPASRRQTREK